MENFLKGLVFIVITGFLGSCDTSPTNDTLPTNKNTVEFDYTKFNAEKTLWDSNNPPNYQYNLEYWNDGFFLPVNTIIFVENGLHKNQIAQKNYNESIFDLTITEIYDRIDGLYLRYNNTTENKEEDYYLTKMAIKYDEANHIPIEIEEHYHVPENLPDMPGYCSTKITEYKIN
jgi:hypothetical protein